MALIRRILLLVFSLVFIVCLSGYGFVTFGDKIGLIEPLESMTFWVRNESDGIAVISEYEGRGYSVEDEGTQPYMMKVAAGYQLQLDVGKADLAKPVYQNLKDNNLNPIKLSEDKTTIIYDKVFSDNVQAKLKASEIQSFYGSEFDVIPIKKKKPGRAFKVVIQIPASEEEKMIKKLLNEKGVLEVESLSQDAKA